MSKDAQKPKPAGSSLTDAVVAALGKIDEKKEAAAEPDPVGAEAGCAATRAAEPPSAAESSKPPGANGFRNGPGSFADLMRQWSGGPPMSHAPASSEPPEPAAKPQSEPAPAPAKVEPAEPKPEPAVVTVEPVETKPVGDADATPSEPPAVAAEAPADEPAEASAGEIRLNYFGRTDVGLVRDHNEDNFLVADLDSGEINPESPQTAGLDGRGYAFAVCDGMGGAAAGEVASQMAVDTILEVMRAEPPPKDRDDLARRVVTAIEEAGHRIFSAAKMDRSRRGMGTTATLAGLVDDHVFVGQVGDSRAYVLRGDTLGLITKDQSLVNQLIEAGQLTEEEAEAFEHSNIILQALGTTEEVTVDLTFLEMRRGDRLMMCSDGLSGLVHSEMIKEVLQDEKDPNAAATKLIQMANAGGGHDNITVIIVDFDGEGLEPVGEAKPEYNQYPLPPSEDTVRGKSLPPRQMGMKAGGTKPGADVKGQDYSAGPSEDVAMPSEGSKTGLIAVIVLLLAAAIVGGWFFFGGGQEMLSGGESADDTGDAPPPPPPPAPGSEPVEPVQVTPSEPDPVEAPVEAPGGEALDATGSVQISSDIEEGTLFVGGEARGAISDGMSISLAPGGYSVEARRGEILLAGPETITVTEGATTQVELNLPVEEAPPSVEDETPPVRRPPPPAPEVRTLPPESGSSSGTSGRRRSGSEGQSGSSRRGRPSGVLPSNPF